MVNKKITMKGGNIYHTHKEKNILQLHRNKKSATGTKTDQDDLHQSIGYGGSNW